MPAIWAWHWKLNTDTPKIIAKRATIAITASKMTLIFAYLQIYHLPNFVESFPG
jgi:hypothetical protein